MARLAGGASTPQGRAAVFVLPAVGVLLLASFAGVVVSLRIPCDFVFWLFGLVCFPFLFFWGGIPDLGPGKNKLTREDP